MLDRCLFMTPCKHVLLFATCAALPCRHVPHQLVGGVDAANKRHVPEGGLDPCRRFIGCLTPSETSCGCLYKIWMSTAVRRLILTVAALTLNLMIAWVLGVMG